MTLDGTHWAYELQRIYSLFLADGLRCFRHFLTIAQKSYLGRYLRQTFIRHRFKNGRGNRREDGFVFEIGPDNDLVVTLFRDCSSAEL